METTPTKEVVARVEVHAPDKGPVSSSKSSKSSQKPSENFDNSDVQDPLPSYPSINNSETEGQFLNTVPPSPTRLTRDFRTRQIQQRGSRGRLDRDSISNNYYGDSVEVGHRPPMFQQDYISPEKQMHTIRQSRRIPRWIWIPLAKSLGIKLQELDKPWLGLIMFVLTLTFGFGYGITLIWYTFYDIKSEYTKSTVLTGTVSIIIGMIWCSLGIYANHLSYVLFSNSKFLDSVRMHSKTIFKLSSAMLMMILSTTFIIMNNAKNVNILDESFCGKVSLNPIVCYFLYGFRVGFSIFALLWNIMVATVLLSVCRTHTIGIRRFIKELEEDGKLIETLRKQRSMNYMDQGDSTDDEWLWDDDLLTSVPTSDFATSGRHNPIASSLPATVPLQRQVSQTSNPHAQRAHSSGGVTIQASSRPGAQSLSSMNNLYIDPNSPQGQRSRLSESLSNEPRSSPGAQSTQVEFSSPNRIPSTATADSQSIDTESSPGPQILNNEDILIRYWKINSRLRATSLSLQRWLSSWVMFIMIWSINYIIFWISHEATLLGIIEFIIPLFLLPLIASAFAEVNMEGSRMLRCICPTDERMDLLFYLLQQPLAITIFGYPLTYSSIVTVISALVLAFTSRLILDEFAKI
ncbi:unnamed protein product [Owenia fusiformis]|uniref:Uncharacterized protein n=1 Tax=Owenia fusiformis TaxID=6347 RepID=A0A8J1Y027_OWEFU|nr:unnamed protein product [Owenia fusiformis]